MLRYITSYIIMPPVFIWTFFSLGVVTSGGTASKGSDYKALNVKVDFDVNQIDAYVSLNIIDDDDVEDNEYILIGLTDPKNGVIGKSGEMRLTLLNEDSKFRPNN